MSTLHQNPPAVKAPISPAEWAAYRASRSARPAPVAWQVGDRVLYHTPRNGSGAGRNIRGVVVKVNAKTVTIEYAMLNRMTQEIVGYKRLAVNPMRLARVIEPVAEANWNSEPQVVADIQMSDWICSQCQKDCGSRVGYIMHIVNCRGNGLVNVKQDGFDLDLLPWENPQDVIDQANAVLDEMDYKPGLGIDDGYAFDEGDELAFMGATLDTLRLGLTEPIVRLTSAQMDEIEDERVGADVCERPYLW